MAYTKITLDLETENIAPRPLKSPSPHYHRNYIVSAGMYLSDSPTLGNMYRDIGYVGEHPTLNKYETITELLHSPPEPPLLIGQNIKFDLLHLLIHPSTRNGILEWYKLGGTIWDTMLVEYLLSAQSKMFPSLDYMAEKYGLPTKDDKIKEYWEDGVPTSKIPKNELLEYMKQDVMNTYHIHEAQVEQVKKLGMERFVMAQMEALMSTVIMEYNGMYFDGNHARHLEKALTHDINEVHGEIVENIQNLTGTAGLPIIWNPASPVQLSKLFYGGDIRYKVKKEVVAPDGTTAKYKSGPKKGEIKYKQEENLFLCTQPKWVDSYEIDTKNTSRSTGEEVLKNMFDYLEKNSGVSPDIDHWKQLLEDLLKFRGIHKELNTYVRGYMQYADVCGGFIHPNYNHAATATGRLSCSNPNLQNVTRGK